MRSLTRTTATIMHFPQWRLFCCRTR